MALFLVHFASVCSYCTKLVYHRDLATKVEKQSVGYFISQKHCVIGVCASTVIFFIQLGFGEQYIK